MILACTKAQHESKVWAAEGIFRKKIILDKRKEQISESRV